ncbi:quinone-dependent dihydroorotate dehydrogenase [Rhodohalobacter mucosus]|nr:quinone-dependent dihydroorotate dehydrogenase [Rhodohalobacter mucosus]
MYKILARPLLFRLNSDAAHDLAISTAGSVSKKDWALSIARSVYTYKDPSLKQKIFGLEFENPIGLAAGFDKNGSAAPLMEALGFGFVEIGSVTADPSTGNPKPRSFRLPKDESLINRLGLNNDGARTISRRVGKLNLNIPLGINIAKTHNPAIMGDAALEDYKISFDLVKDIADYITINISCPNTEEGKTFEDPETLNSLLKKLSIRDDSSLPPVLVKFSVDLGETMLKELIEVCESHSVGGYVATNTSSERDNLKTSESRLSRIGRGGLSGQAIRNKSTAMIEKISDYTNREKPIIGVGGVNSAEHAIEKLKAGADLLQIYTGLVYEGPGLVKRINKGLSGYLKKEGLDNIYQIRSSSKKSATGQLET